MAIAHRNGTSTDRDSRAAATEDLQRGRRELRSLGARGAEIADDLRELSRLETELARAEMDESRSALTQGAISGAAAALIGFWVLGFLGAAMTFALAEIWDAWLAALVTAGVFLLVALVAGLIARSRFKKFSPTPKRTIASIREDVTWLRGLMKQSATSVSRGR